jgi:hypothetical protein
MNVHGASPGSRIASILVLCFQVKKDVDARHEAGHDGAERPLII